MENISHGSFMARVSSASGALPLEGGIVRIRGASENNSDIVFSLVTDNDGVTPVIQLPAPQVELSLSSGAGGAPYSTYDVTISKEGYYTKKIANVAVFSGILSVLPVNMIPYDTYAGGAAYPRGNNRATVTENENL